MKKAEECRNGMRVEVRREEFYIVQPVNKYGVLAHTTH